MPRDFLFAANDEDAALTRLLAKARQVTGFMDGAPGGPLPGWHSLEQDNRALIETLHARLEAQYPQAGLPFYAVRLWTNLLWQPAYLAVIATHAHEAVPSIGLISQQAKGADISGFRLRPGPQRGGTQEERIALAGAELRSFADSVLAEINSVTKLKRLPALRLLTDRMLGLMVRLPQYRPGTDLIEQQRFCTLWLAAMGLTGQGDIEIISLADGRQVPITARKGCCLDYLAFSGAYCSSCPKQDDKLRITRQTTEAMAELEHA